MNATEPKIGFYCRAAEVSTIEHFQTLSRVLGFSLSPLEHSNLGSAKAAVLIDPSNDLRRAVERQDVAMLAVFRQKEPPEKTSVTFAANAAWPFQGRKLPAVECARFGEPVPGSPLAADSQGCVWSCARPGSGKRRDYVAVPAGWLESPTPLFEQFHGDKFLNLLPVLEWLRAVTKVCESRTPRIRACIQFDDPNLHSPRYGFISFELLAQHAREHNYHVAMATVPLDAYWVSGKAAAIFRRHTDRLSFLVHGNNHTPCELAEPRMAAEREWVLHQALARIRRLERLSGLDVARVMAAPHGACSEAMLDAMAGNGFEAASISCSSLKKHNPRAPWVRTLGIKPVDIVAGLPVMNRFRMRRGAEPNILMAAYLGQPIIPVGHHWDLEKGHGLLEETANVINSLGEVAWMSQSELARSNFAHSHRSGHMDVHLYSRHASLHFLPDTRSVALHAPWLDLEREEIQCNSIMSSREFSRADANTPLRHGLGSGEGMTVRVVRTTSSTRPSAAPQTRTSLYAVGRRVLTEVRDRAMPRVSL